MLKQAEFGFSLAPNCARRRAYRSAFGLDASNVQALIAQTVRNESATPSLSQASGS